MISVIVPIYKVERYLRKCIDSIILQTYKELEIILIDDGSPDECPQICDEYAVLDNRIKVVHKTNAGVSSARNEGLKIAKGEYIGFIDPDDYIAPNMYDEMLIAMKETNADMAICGYEYVDEINGVDIKRSYKIRPNEIMSQKKVFESYANMPPTTRHGVCNKLFKQQIIKDLRFVEGIHSAEDVLFIDEYSLKLERAVFVHKPLYYNLVRKGSATHGGLNTEKLAKSFLIHEKMYKDTIRLYPDLKNCSMAFLLDVLLLKYNEAKKNIQNDKKKMLNYMKKFIRRYGRRAILNKEIYWKTKLVYLFMR